MAYEGHTGFTYGPHTFTDRDLYEMMMARLPPVFWVPWERLAPELRVGVGALANDIYERLRGPEQPHEKPAGTESAGSGHLEPCADCGAPTDQGHHLDAESQFRADEVKRLHREVGAALMDIVYGPCPQCEANDWLLRLPEREWQCGTCKFIAELPWPTHQR